ncbi:hypothetical protein HDV01_000073 [Terramyces sp. JEL0728]|nr:hypothetical protein HDV01_000073 [Terramyces sp. JEL0728]
MQLTNNDAIAQQVVDQVRLPPAPESKHNLLAGIKKLLKKKENESDLEKVEEAQMNKRKQKKEEKKLSLEEARPKFNLFSFMQKEKSEDTVAEIEATAAEIEDTAAEIEDTAAEIETPEAPATENAEIVPEPTDAAEKAEVEEIKEEPKEAPKEEAKETTKTKKDAVDEKIQEAVKSSKVQKFFGLVKKEKKVEETAAKVYDGSVDDAAVEPETAAEEKTDETVAVVEEAVAKLTEAQGTIEPELEAAQDAADKLEIEDVEKEVKKAKRKSTVFGIFGKKPTTESATQTADDEAIVEPESEESAPAAALTSPKKRFTIKNIFKKAEAEAKKEETQEPAAEEAEVPVEDTTAKVIPAAESEPVEEAKVESPKQKRFSFKFPTFIKKADLPEMVAETSEKVEETAVEAVQIAEEVKEATTEEVKEATTEEVITEEIKEATTEEVIAEEVKEPVEESAESKDSIEEAKVEEKKKRFSLNFFKKSPAKVIVDAEAPKVDVTLPETEAMEKAVEKAAEKVTEGVEKVAEQVPVAEATEKVVSPAEKKLFGIKFPTLMRKKKDVPPAAEIPEVVVEAAKEEPAQESETVDQPKETLESEIAA